MRDRSSLPCRVRTVAVRCATMIAVGVLSLASGMAVCAAEGAGQEDLDKATVAKLTAKTPGDLEAVVDLCEAAIAKGLDQSNQTFATDLLKSTLYEHAALFSRLIFDRQPPDPRWQRIRQICLEKLQRALDIDPQMGNVHLLVARLQALPGGDRDVAKSAIEKAIPALADEPELLSVAHQVRASLTDDREQILSDLNKAIELYPRNLAAWRARGVYYLTTGQFDKALEDLQELLNRDPDDVMAHQAIAQALRQLKQYDKAMEHLDQVLESDPDSSLAYNLKARIEEEQGHLAAALEYLNEAVRVQPQDLSALLYRARLLAAQQQFDLASSDVEQVLRLRPDLPQAILLRSVILAAQDRYGEAIADLQTLLRQQPDSLELKMQIAALYEADQRPRKAIELYGEILASDAENWLALRRRGDAYLSVAKHAEAIRDYEAALQLHTDDAGLLNNLAWVLATSPHDALRDGKRSLELAQKACELTKYEAAHILSTLAASHAELGDFPAAIQWSEKAVALNSAQPQLAKELESYRAGKPWREEQQVDENTAELNVPLADESLPVFDDVPDLKQPDVKKSDDTPGTPPQPAPQSPESADGP